MRCAVDPEPQGAAARVQGHPYRRRSAVQPLSDPRLSLRCRDDRRAAAGAAAARRGAAAACRRRCDRRAAAGARRAARGARAGWRRLRDEAWRCGRRSTWPGSAPASPEARDPDAIIVNEYTLLPEHCGSNRPGSYFGSSPAAGLGWGAGAALGVKLAEPEPAGHRRARRRLVHVLEPGRGASRRGDAPTAGAVHRHQQRDVGRGAPRDPGHVPAGRSGAQQQAALDRPRRIAGLRDRSAPPPAAMASGSRTRPNCPPRSTAPCTPSMSRKRQALLNVISAGGAGG